eukprot:jgi/Ulvmu1/3770/UM176_0004.1
MSIQRSPRHAAWHHMHALLLAAVLCVLCMLLCSPVAASVVDIGAATTRADVDLPAQHRPGSHSTQHVTAASSPHAGGGDISDEVPTGEGNLASPDTLPHQEYVTPPVAQKAQLGLFSQSHVTDRTSDPRKDELRAVEIKRAGAGAQHSRRLLSARHGHDGGDNEAHEVPAISTADVEDNPLWPFHSRGLTMQCFTCPCRCSFCCADEESEFFRTCQHRGNTVYCGSVPPI